MKKFMITIPQPCHEDWAAMSPMEKGRFCGSCQKQVIDFSAMTDGQLAAFFKKPAAGICGRFAADQLNKELTVQRKQNPLARHFFVMTIPAFLLSLKATAQGEPRSIKGKPAVIVSHQPKVVNTVKEKGVKDKAVVRTQQISLSHPGRVIDSTSVFKQGRQLINSNNTSTALTVSREILTGFLGGINIVEIKNSPEKPVPLIKKTSNAFPRGISVYPNPVKRNSICKISTSKLEEGIYRLTLLNNAGDIFCNKEVIIDKKNSTIEINTGNTTPGTAFVQLTHTRTGRQTTEKIIVQ